MEHQRAMESPSSTEKIATRSHHLKKSSSSSSSSSSEEDLLDFKANELRHPVKNFSLDNTHMEWPSSPELAEQHETGIGTEMSGKERSTANVNDGQDCIMDDNQDRYAPSISTFDENARNTVQMGLNVVGSEADERSSYMGFIKESLTSQATVETETYDPDRIPSSVFSKLQHPTDCSQASNDSMFSIHFGSLSFSRDQVGNLDMGEEPKVSADPAPEGASSSMECASTKHEQPSTPGAAVAKGNVEARVGLPTTLTVPHTPSMPRHSDSSGTSVQSFAFPILVAADVNSKSDKERKENNKSVKERKETPTLTTPETIHKENMGWFSCWQCHCPSCC